MIGVVHYEEPCPYWKLDWTREVIVSEGLHPHYRQVLRTYVIGGSQIADTGLSEAGQVSAPQTTQMAVLVIATVPILLVYPFLQKYFTKGVLTGAIKS